MEIDKEIDKLRLKIEERISEGRNKCDGLSAKELKDILFEQISKYNLILVNKVQKDIKSLNRKIAQAKFLSKKIPYIDSITPTIYEDGTEELVIVFSQNGEWKGSAIVSRNLNIKFEFIQNDYSISDIMDFFGKNVLNFVTYFDSMDRFREEYPGFSYEWSTKEKNLYSEELSDGFIVARFDLNDLSSTRASLEKIEDLELARFKSRKYGELYDFVDFFNDNILNSLKVDEESLNPLYKQMIKNYRRNKGNSRILTLK